MSKTDTQTLPLLLPGEPFYLKADSYPLNIHRFYCITLLQNLFGEWCLLIQWGRQGTMGTQRIITCGTLEHAQALAHKTIQKRLRSKTRIGTNYSP